MSSSQEIRQWALESGYEVGQRGPLPANISEAFSLAQTTEDNDVIELAKSAFAGGSISGPPLNTGPGLYQTGNSGKNDRGATGYTTGGKPIPRQAANIEIGVPFYFPFSTPYRNSWEVYSEAEVTVTQLENMRRTDGQARALYRLLTLPILAALKTCTFTAAPGQDGGEEEADFIKMMLTMPDSSGGMVIPFKKFMSQLLLATFHGFSAFELVYWVPKRGPLAGKVTLRKAAYRPPETLTFLLNDMGEFDGWRQRTFFQGHTVDVKIPGENGIYWSVQEEERPFYGVSMFESAFYHYDKKVKLYYVAHVAAQRAAVGTRIGTMPPNPDHADKENFVAALSKLGWAQSIIMPADFTVQTLHEVGSFDYLSYINHHNNQMSKTILAQWFDQDTGTGKGGAPVVDMGESDDSHFVMLLESLMTDIESVINNQLIPRFVDWNFGSSKYPIFAFGAFTDEQRAAMQQTFNLLAVAGENLQVSQDFMHALEEQMAQRLGLPVDYDEVQKDWDQQKEMQQAQDEATFLQSQNIQTAATPPTTNSGNPSPNPPPVQAPKGGTNPKTAKDSVQGK